MTDTSNNIDKDKFEIYARVQIRSGRCMKIRCVHYDNTIGPVIDNNNCVECYKKAMQRLEA